MNNGNQTTKTVPGANDKSWTQTWDHENRLVGVEKVKGSERKTITFSYDPFGRRIGKNVAQTRYNATTQQYVTTTESYAYVYDNEDIVLEIYTDPGNTVTKTFYTHGPGIDEPLALERGGQFHYYHADGLGSIVKITDANRNVVQSYSYDSFGMVTPTNNSFRNGYTYTGREWDKETGLYYFRARYYDPTDGRFIQKDPIGFAGGVNVYAYTKNNPINMIDPSGLDGVTTASFITTFGGQILSVIKSPQAAAGELVAGIAVDSASHIFNFAPNQTVSDVGGIATGSISTGLALASGGAGAGEAKGRLKGT